MLPNFGEHFALWLLCPCSSDSLWIEDRPRILLLEGAQLQGEASARGHEDVDFVGGGYL